jgi:hypothetical protein
VVRASNSSPLFTQLPGAKVFSETQYSPGPLPTGLPLQDRGYRRIAAYIGSRKLIARFIASW